MPWMIYGANGYTGELIAREAVSRGLKPLLAGRTAAKVEPLAASLGLQARVFDFAHATAISRSIEGMGLVLHCAGLFSATAAPMMAACLAAHAHYLDITGEISVFEHARTLDAAAHAAGIVVCPGVGFDVIPTDCVAAALKTALPDATHLALGFDSRSGFSPGTAKTSVEGLAQGGKVRKDGRIVSVPLAYKTRRIDFGDGEKLAVTIPWGDVSTAYATTGIPNIEVYIPGSPAMVARLRRANRLRWLIGMDLAQRFVKWRIERTVKGPSAAKRAAHPTFVWGEATNAGGEKRTARIKTANGYSLMVTGALAVAEHLMANDAPGGAYTPAKLVVPISSRACRALVLFRWPEPPRDFVRFQRRSCADCADRLPSSCHQRIDATCEVLDNFGVGRRNQQQELSDMGGMLKSHPAFGRGYRAGGDRTNPS